MFAIQQGKQQRKDRSGPGTETLALIPHKSDKMMWKWLPLSARTFLFTFIDLEGSVSNKQDVITTLCSVIRFLPFLTRLVWLMLKFLLRASTSWFMPVSVYTVTVFTWQNIFVSSLLSYGFIPFVSSVKICSIVCPEEAEQWWRSKISTHHFHQQALSFYLNVGEFSCRDEGARTHKQLSYWKLPLETMTQERFWIFINIPNKFLFVAYK